MKLRQAEDYDSDEDDSEYRTSRTLHHYPMRGDFAYGDMFLFVLHYCILFHSLLSSFFFFRHSYLNDCPAVELPCVFLLYLEIFSDLPEPKKGVLKSPHKMMKWMSDLEGKMVELHSKVQDMQNNPIVHSHHTPQEFISNRHAMKMANVSERSEQSENVSDRNTQDLSGIYVMSSACSLALSLSCYY